MLEVRMSSAGPPDRRMMNEGPEGPGSGRPITRSGASSTCHGPGAAGHLLLPAVRDADACEEPGSAASGRAVSLGDGARPGATFDDAP